MRYSRPLASITLILCFALSCLAWTPWGAVYESARDERSMGDQAADKKISLSIKADLADKDSKLALKVHVYCFLKHVYLVGAVDDQSFRAVAVKTARRTEGVRKVTSYFKPETDTTAEDLKLAAKVRAELIGNGDLSSTQIEQEVMNGEVVLLGMVRSQADAVLAAKVAGSVPGVRKITSFLIPPK
jgi:hyperosmotically inducible protein